jgi:ribose 5-phosphate isomerase B
MDLQFDLGRPIVIGADHAGFEYKRIIIEKLAALGHEVQDLGTYSPDSVDYPDFAHPVALAVEGGEVAFGILVCGSANGVAITANKHQGIRAAICWQEDIAVLARQHNNANIICIPSRFVSADESNAMVATFMATSFEGGRHEKRVEKMTCV